MGPHTGYIIINNPGADLGNSSQQWVDAAHSDSQAKGYYNYTIRLSCLQ